MHDPTGPGSPTVSQPPSVRVVGAGRAGGSFALALAAAGWRVDGPVGRDGDLASAARGVDLVLLAVPDSAVASVAGEVRPDPATVVAHVAGSLTLAVLAPHERRASIHPLVSMPHAATGSALLGAGAWFAVAGSGPDELAVVERAVGDLHGRAVAVADADRARYHAAACIASNHLVALLGQVDRVGGSVGVPLEAFFALARSSLDNVEALGPAAALTGPVARGDHVTVAAHLAALPADECPAYAAMALQAQRLVRPGSTAPPWADPD